MKKTFIIMICSVLLLCAVPAIAEQNQAIDLIIFAGQSNMAGRGVTSEQWPEEAPKVAEGAGWEFRAVSDPTKLYPIEEPFGLNENKRAGINDAWGPVLSKSGSMVSAFVNAYYAECGVPVIAVSASKGGSGISEWVPGSNYLTDCLGRLADAKNWLETNGYQIRHIFCAWCQGETDGDNGTPAEEYTAYFHKILDEMTASGVEKMFMIRIGQCNAPDGEGRYQPMIELQDKIAASDDRVIMVSELLAGMRERGLMKDDFHYFQQGYNEVGTDAGKNAALFVKELDN